MGGIAGVVTINPSDLWDYKSLNDQMLDAMKHRAEHKTMQSIERIGSIGSRFHDYESAGKSMAYSHEHDISVCLDGNIFHIQDDSTCLDPTTQDAQIILRLYLQFKDLIFEKIDGSYAVAIWDGRAQTMLLAKDRLGTKPLYYASTNHQVLFASEIKGILSSDLVDKRVDLKALNNFLSYGHVPNPETLFESILQVQPGHVIKFGKNGTKNQAYWKFQYPDANLESGHDREYIQEFYRILERAVDRRIRRYPKAGAFLSGGLDTSGVVAVMKAIKKASFQTFTAGFDEKAYDETEDAKIVAEHVGVDQILTKVRFDKDFPALLEKIVWHHDAPFSDTSAIPSFHAAKLARNSVNTVLTGDFPDQLIGGSGHQIYALNRQENDSFYKTIFRRMNLHHAMARIPVTAGTVSFKDKIMRFFYRESFPLEEQRILTSMPLPPWLKNYLYTPSFKDINALNDPMAIGRAMYSDVKGQGLLNKLLYFDVLSYAVDDLMIKVERMTSANGLEAISPFHDIDLVDFVARLPEDLKIRGERQKYIMREALKPMLPKHTMNKKKQGFAMPIGEWLVRSLSDYVREILLDSKTLGRGYFNKDKLTCMVENFLAGKTDYASGSEATIITLITIELWHRQFIDQTS